MCVNMFRLYYVPACMRTVLLRWVCYVGPEGRFRVVKTVSSGQDL